MRARMKRLSLRAAPRCPPERGFVRSSRVTRCAVTFAAPGPRHSREGAQQADVVDGRVRRPQLIGEPLGGHRLRSKSPRKIDIMWREDVRQWHPGQAWIWEEGGFGVFDPGINALSILTALVDAPIRLCDATLEIPANRAMPIAARLEMESADGCAIIADFDWRQAGLQSWVIDIETDTGNARLSGGGNRLEIDGRQQQLKPAGEYAAMYAHFAALVRTGRSDIDTAPLVLAELALATGCRIVTEPFRD